MSNPTQLPVSEYSQKEITSRTNNPNEPDMKPSSFISCDCHNPFPPNPFVSYPVSRTGPCDCPCAGCLFRTYPLSSGNPCHDRANHSCGADPRPDPGRACCRLWAGEKVRHGDGEVASHVDPTNGRHGTAGVATENGVVEVEVESGNHLCHDCHLYRVESLCDGPGHSLGSGPCHDVEGWVFCGCGAARRQRTQSRTALNLNQTRTQTRCLCPSRYPNRNLMIKALVRASHDVAP